MQIQRDREEQDIPMTTEGAASDEMGSLSSGGNRVRGRGRPTPEHRLKTLQERNRRAQKKFRDKQKARYASMEEELEALRRQIRELSTENERLSKANALLERVVAMNRHEAGAGSSDRGDGSAQGERPIELPAAVQEQRQPPDEDKDRPLRGSPALRVGSELFYVTYRAMEEGSPANLLEKWHAWLEEMSKTYDEFEELFGREVILVPGLDPTKQSTGRPLQPAGGPLATAGDSGSSEHTTGSSSGVSGRRQLGALSLEEATDLPRASQGDRKLQVARQLQEDANIFVGMMVAALRECPLRCRQLTLMSSTNTLSMNIESFLRFHDRVARSMRLDDHHKWRTAAMYLRYRNKLENCAKKQQELLKSAAANAEELHGKGTASWMQAYNSINQIKQCLDEETEITIELLGDLMSKAWTPVHLMRSLRSSTPFKYDAVLLSHIFTAQVGLIEPLSVQAFLRQQDNVPARLMRLERPTDPTLPIETAAAVAAAAAAETADPAALLRSVVQHDPQARQLTSAQWPSDP